MRTTTKERFEVLARLQKLGIDCETGDKLRRIAATLRNWFEYECGTGNSMNGTTSIEREGGTDDGKPMLRVQFMGRDGRWNDRSNPIADKETGARKRLKNIMAPHSRRLVAYVQGDCRGAALWIIRKADVKAGERLDAVYTRGTAVY